jgi:hypothetical protein
MGAERQVLDFVLQPSDKAFDKGMKGMQKSVERFSKAAGDAFDIAETAKSTGRSVSSIISELTKEKGQKVGFMTSGLAKMAEKLPLFAKFAKALVPILGVALNPAIAGLTLTVGKALEKWKEFTIEQEKFSRAMGMTRDEVREFSAEVISASGKYGVALGKVQNMSFFLAKGYKGARHELLQFSGAMSNFVDITETSEESAQKLAFVLTRRMKVSFNDAEKAMYGFREVAKDSSIAVEEIIDILGEHDSFLRVQGKKNALVMAAQGAALIGSMREVGAKTEEVNAVIAQLGDQSSKLMDHFRTANFDVRKFADQIGQLVSTMRAAGEGTPAYEKALADLGERFGLTQFTAEAIADSVGLLTKKMDIFDKAMDTSVEEHRKKAESELGLWKKWGRSWEKVVSGVSGSVEWWFGPGSVMYQTFDQFTAGTSAMLETVFIGKWGKVSGAFNQALDNTVGRIRGVLTWFGILDKEARHSLVFTPATPREKEVAAKRSKLTHANTMMAKGVWDEAKYAQYLAAHDLTGASGSLAGGERAVPKAAVPGPGKDVQHSIAAGMDTLVQKTEEQSEMQKRVLEIEEEKRRDRRIRAGGGSVLSNPYAGAAAVAEQGG